MELSTSEGCWMSLLNDNNVRSRISEDVKNRIPEELKIVCLADTIIITDSNTARDEEAIVEAPHRITMTPTVTTTVITMVDRAR